MTIQGCFVFSNIDRIIYGPGSIKQLPEQLKRFGVSRAIIVTGHSLYTKTDVIKNIENILGDTHINTFSEIKQHAPINEIKKAVQFVKENKADIIISVGGGSPIDASKVIIKLFADEQGYFVKHIAIPTTLSAAEYTQGAGYTNENHQKVAVQDPNIAPQVIILDSEVTLSTPEKLWLSTGIRAVDHAVETLYSPGAPHPINDSLAYEALRLFFEYLPKSKQDLKNLEYRQYLQVASAMSIFPNTSVSAIGLSHLMGHQLGATYSIPHGITSCITLPHVIKYFAEKNSKPHVQQLARALHVLRPEKASGNDKIDAAQVSDLLHDLLARLDLTSDLKTYKLTKEDLNNVAERTVDVVKKLIGEGANITVSDVLELLKRSY
jgi:alcohol dehydrogenase class IV